MSGKSPKELRNLRSSRISQNTETALIFLFQCNLTYKLDRKVKPNKFVVWPIPDLLENVQKIEDIIRVEEKK